MPRHREQLLRLLLRKNKTPLSNFYFIAGHSAGFFCAVKNQALT